MQRLYNFVLSAITNAPSITIRRNASAYSTPRCFPFVRAVFSINARGGVPDADLAAMRRQRAMLCLPRGFDIDKMIRQIFVYRFWRIAHFVV